MMRSKRFPPIVLALFALGLVLKLFGAWWWAYEAHYDRGRPCLVSKHMADGTAFNVFGYGMAYLANIEPAIGAIFCKILGPTGFAANMGTVVIGMLILPFTYLIARKCGGHVAGVVALICSVMGPFGYFFFTLIPRGGYAATILFGLVLVYLAGRIVERERAEADAMSLYIWLGIAGGLAWWQNQLCTSALLTAALWLACVLKFRVFKLRVVVAGICFFIGSAPWWWWNATHGWATFGFTGAIGKASFPHAIKLYFWDRLFSLINMPYEWGPLRYATPVLMGIAALFACLMLVRHVLRNRAGNEWVYTGLTLTYVAISATLFATSSFSGVPSARYLVTMPPVIGIFIGMLVAWLWATRARKLAPIIPVVIVAGQCFAMKNEFPRERPVIRDRAAQQIKVLAQQEKIEVLFADIWSHWMNFATREELFVSHVHAEPYAAYEKVANRALNPGLIDDVEGFEGFARASRTTLAKTNLPPYEILYNMQQDASATGHPILPPSALTAATLSDTDETVLAPIVDGDIATRHAVKVSREGDARGIRFTLDQARTLTGIRLWCIGEDYPGHCRVEGKRADEGTWVTLLETVRSTPYYWSGPRWYINGLYFRLHYAFASHVPITELRLSFDPIRKYDYTANIAEIAFTELPSASVAAPTRTDEVALTERLAEEGVEFCYADRWLATQIDAVSEGGIAVTEPSFMARGPQSLPSNIRNEYRPLTQHAGRTALVTEQGEADALATALAAYGLTTRRIDVGPFAAFVSDALDARPDLLWVGYGLYAGAESLPAKPD